MTANTAQSEAWNGDEGQYFVAQRARHERMGQQHTARLLATAAIGPAEVVLDVGCGCGETTIGAARAARSGRALGVDLSAVMLAEARRLAGREGVRNARFEQADAQVHAFPAAGFDVAISGFGVMFFADRRAAGLLVLAGDDSQRVADGPVRSRGRARHPARAARSG